MYESELAGILQLFEKVTMYMQLNSDVNGMCEIYQYTLM